MPRRIQLFHNLSLPAVIWLDALLEIPALLVLPLEKESDSIIKGILIQRSFFHFHVGVGRCAGCWLIGPHVD